MHYTSCLSSDYEVAQLAPSIYNKQELSSFKTEFTVLIFYSYLETE